MEMDLSFEGRTLDASKCSKLSMDEKRELVYQLSEWSGATEILHLWSRQEILQILCVEMGKERKYTGLTKLKIIEHLLRIVSEKKSRESEATKDLEEGPFLASSRIDTKRQRKTDDPSRLSVPLNSHVTKNCASDLENVVYCKNSACKAILKRDDAFCKRCSCCICCQYDDNKDPSLWLICSSEPLFQGVACGLSCHLDCALKQESFGIGQNRHHGKLDGCFRCIACGKVNDLLGCWRKQLVMARDTRRVDILCYRVSLSLKLFNGTRKYQNPNEIVEEAARKLEDEVGPLSGLPVKMGRGIVNRLSSGPEVQKLCALALESLDKMLANTISHSLQDLMVQDSNSNVPIGVRFENDVLNCSLIERSQSPATNCSSLSNPSSVKDETNNNTPRQNPFVNRADNYLSYCKDKEKIGSANMTTINAVNCISMSGASSADVVPLLDGKDAVHTVSSTPNSDVQKLENERSSERTSDEEMSTDNGSNAPVQTGEECVPFVSHSEVSLPVTPCKLEILKDVNGRNARSKSGNTDPLNGTGKGEEEPQDGSTSKKRGGERWDKDCTENGHSDKGFEYYVKVIRWLECEGHVEKNFRQKFLTWYSLRATPQETRIVKTFVDTFIEDPASLAEQLVDAFSERISNGRSSVVPAGFCVKLWH